MTPYAAIRRAARQAKPAALQQRAKAQSPVMQPEPLDANRTLLEQFISVPREARAPIVLPENRDYLESREVEALRFAVADTEREIARRLAGAERLRQEEHKETLEDLL